MIRLGKPTYVAGARPKRPAPSDARHVLVIRFGGLGEFVQSLAAAKAIREYHRGAKITLLTVPAYEAFANACPFFDVVEADGAPSEPRAIAELLRRLRACKYDMVYDLEGSARTNRYFHLLKPFPPMWNGPAEGCSHRHGEAARSQMHLLDRLADQLAQAGVGLDAAVAQGSPPPGSLAAGPVAAAPLSLGAGRARAPLPDLSWVRASQRNAPRLSAQHHGIEGPFALIAFSTAAEDYARRWPADKYADLCKRIARAGLTPVLIGSQQDLAPPSGLAPGQRWEDPAQKIVRAEPATRNLVGRTDLFQLAALGEEARIAIGNDSGPMHVFASAGTACLVLLSKASDPARACPRGRAGVMSLRAPDLSQITVDEVVSHMRNIGAFDGTRLSA
jgi:ADP-heptose:LPS heptosyltransferase